jgi:osmoprotectant transport system permease protein
VTTLLEATFVHILLAYSGLAIAVAIGIPLAVLSLRSRTAGVIISAITGIGQAIPILALVAFMVPLAGIGFLPSVLVIVVSTLMPIVRNTYAGISSVDPELADAAAGIGLTWTETVTEVRVPLSLHAIFSGIKFSLHCRNPNPQETVPTTERSKVQYLLTMMCAQKVRRQIRDQQAGISGLSKQPLPL